MDDESLEGFAPKRRWYQVHVTALILALVGIGAGVAFTPESRDAASSPTPIAPRPSPPIMES